MFEISIDDLLHDAAHSLGLDSPEKVPGDLTDLEVDIVLGQRPGTSSVKRSRGNFPIPSYTIGRLRRTPLSAVLKYKKKELNKTQFLEESRNG